MTRKEAAKAKRLLKPYATELRQAPLHFDPTNVVVIVSWAWGAVNSFHRLEDVVAWVEDLK